MAIMEPTARGLDPGAAAKLIERLGLDPGSFKALFLGRILHGERVNAKMIADDSGMSAPSGLAEVCDRLEALDGVDFKIASQRSPVGKGNMGRAPVYYWLAVPGDPVPKAEPYVNKKTPAKTHTAATKPAIAPAKRPAVPDFGSTLKVTGILDNDGKIILFLQNGSATYTAELTRPA